MYCSAGRTGASRAAVVRTVVWWWSTPPEGAVIRTPTIIAIPRTAALRFTTEVTTAPTEKVKHRQRTAAARHNSNLIRTLLRRRMVRWGSEVWWAVKVWWEMAVVAVGCYAIVLERRRGLTSTSRLTWKRRLWKRKQLYISPLPTYMKIVLLLYLQLHLIPVWWRIMVFDYILPRSSQVITSCIQFFWMNPKPMSHHDHSWGRKNTFRDFWDFRTCTLYISFQNPLGLLPS